MTDMPNAQLHFKAAIGRIVEKQFARYATLRLVYNASWVRVGHLKRAVRTCCGRRPVNASKDTS